MIRIVYIKFVYLELTLILNARLNPEAKNPPNGPIIDANKDKEMECNMYGYICIVAHFKPICKIKMSYNNQFVQIYMVV